MGEAGDPVVLEVKESEGDEAPGRVEGVGDAAGQLVEPEIGSAEVGEAAEGGRDCSPDLVIVNAKVLEALHVTNGRRERPREGVEGDVEHLEACEAAEGFRDGSREATRRGGGGGEAELDEVGEVP